MSIKNTNCCVFGCNSRKSKDASIHFHYFPPKGKVYVTITNRYGIVQQMEKRKAWEYILLMGTPITKNMRVCSKHFKPEDYRIKSGNLINKISPRLKHLAIPSQNLPVKVHQKTNILEDQQRYARLQRRDTMRLSKLDNQELEIAEQYCSVQESILETNIVRTYNEKEQLAIEGLLSLISLNNVNVPSNPEQLSTEDKGIQVTSGDLITCFSSTITTESQLNSITGIDSFQLLNTLNELLDKFYSEQRHRVLSRKAKIILVFMKLKLALSWKVISFFFKITPSACGIIFDEYIQILANILKSCITWPSINEIRNNMPKCFKDFPYVRIVLDCTEIPVQRPKCLCCRVRTYSMYKGRPTLKIMTGVSPSALVTFVSKAYGGRTSDQAIFEKSGLVDKLEPHINSVIVDKGFLIEDLCITHFIKIIRPAFLRHQKQFSKKSAKKNIIISRARVHVERVNQRLRLFNIFNNTYPWSLVRHIDDIVTVCAAMVNLQPPLFSDDKC